MLSALRTLDPLRAAAPGQDLDAMTGRRRLPEGAALDALGPRERADVGLPVDAPAAPVKPVARA